MAIPPFGSAPTPDATSSVKGKLKLAQDLSGTAALPTVVSLSLSGDTAINHKLTNVTDPTNAQDAATKLYVDNAASGAGLSNKGASRLATAAVLPTNIYNNGTAGVGATLTGVSFGALTVDGVAVALNDLIVVKDEVAQANNGIYKMTTLGTGGILYVLTRATNMDQATEIGQAYSFITAGATNINTSWNVNSGTYVVGTTAIVWNQFSAAPTFVAGDGLALSGVTFSVNVDTTTIAIVADTLERAALTGDVTASLGGAATTLATVNSNVGTFGSATTVPVITVNGKGLTTAVTTATIVAGASETFAFFNGN